MGFRTIQCFIIEDCIGKGRKLNKTIKSAVFMMSLHRDITIGRTRSVSWVVLLLVIISVTSRRVRLMI